MTFWMIIFSLVVVAVVGLIIPLLRQPKVQQGSERNAQNIHIAREQLAELERMNAAGELDTTEYQASKDELEKSLLTDIQQDSTPTSGKGFSPQLTAIMVGIFVPLAAFALYGWLGTPEALQASVQQEQELPPNHPPMTGGMQQAPDINKMVEGLRKKLEASPNNPEGWNMLGRSYMNMERFAEAAAAYRKLHELQPEDASVMLLLADALAMSNDGKVADESEQLALKALAKEPENVTALWLAGLGASEKGDKLKALEYWKKLLPLLNDSPMEQAEVQGLIRQMETVAP